MWVLALQRFLFAVCCRNPYGSVTDPDRLWYQFVQFLNCIWAMPSRSLQQNFWKSQVNLRRSKVWPFLTMVETLSFVTRIDKLSSPELSPVMLRIYLSTCYHIFIYFPPWILLSCFVRSSFLSFSFICFRVSGTRFRGCYGQRCGTMYFTEHQCHFTWNWSTEYLSTEDKVLTLSWNFRMWLDAQFSKTCWICVSDLALFQKLLRQDSRLSNKFSYASVDSVRLRTCWNPNNRCCVWIDCL